MKLITMTAMKGGVGKTTLTYNFAEWLASKGYKVLLFDLDPVQCSLTRTYQALDKTEFSIINLFKDEQDPNRGKIELIPVKPNIDLIPGDFQLDAYEHQTLLESDKNRRIFEWFRDAMPSHALNYDYVIFDCHPNFDIATCNAVLCSNVLFTPITPSEYSYTSLADTKIRLDNFKRQETDAMTGKSLVSTEFYGIANNVKHNTASSRIFLDKIKNLDEVIATVPNRELFNKATLQRTPLNEMKDDKAIFYQNRKFFDDVEQAWQEMKSVVDNSGDNLINQIQKVVMQND